MLAGALMLTAVNLLMRFAGTGFQVWLSGRIGPAGIGLLQLILSVNMLALTLGTAGGRTTAMYLTAEAMGKENHGEADRLLSGCFVYSILCAGTVSVALFILSPVLAEYWIGTADALPALRAWAVFLPVICLTGIMTGYFTAAGRIGTLAAVEVAEQFFSILITASILTVTASNDRSSSCRTVVLGSCLGTILTLICLIILYGLQATATDCRIPTADRILRCAVPLAIADDLKAGISTVENLLVPRRLSHYSGISDPLAVFGKISGMVFPVMMLPASLLSSLAEILIPELARCNAVGSRNRIRYLVRRNLRAALAYGLCCSGLLYLLSEPLCARLYPNEEISGLMRRFSLLIPILYCDLIADAMTKGLGQQAACARYSVISNVLDVGLMFFLLPRYGISGYYFSFTLTHALNFALSLRKVLAIANVRPNLSFALLMPLCAVAAVSCGTCFADPIRSAVAFVSIYFGLCFYLGILRKGDIRWVCSMIISRHKPKKSADTTNS